MLDKSSFPRISADVWWGIRADLQQDPLLIIDHLFLCEKFELTEPDAREQLTDLKRVGVLSESGLCTELGARWCRDLTYPVAIDLMIENTYPAALITTVGFQPLDLKRLTAWFMRVGLGFGASENRAKTYLLMRSSPPAGA
jgi:hypothetical protein